MGNIKNIIFYNQEEINKVISQIEMINCPQNRAMMVDFLLDVSIKKNNQHMIFLRHCDLIDLAKALNSDGHLTAPFMVHDNLDCTEAQGFWHDIRYHWPDGQHLYNVVSKGTPFETE